MGGNLQMGTDLACLINLARLHGLPADPAHISHAHVHFTEKEITLAGRD